MKVFILLPIVPNFFCLCLKIKLKWKQSTNYCRCLVEESGDMVKNSWVGDCRWENSKWLKARYVVSLYKGDHQCLNIIEIFCKYSLSSWHPRVQICRIFLGFEPPWGGVRLVMHRYLNYLSKLESMELQTIFKLFYVLQVNLDIFLQKKQNGTGYLCIQANFLVGKKKNQQKFSKNFI